MDALITGLENGYELQLDNCNPLFELLCYYQPAELAAAIKVLIAESKDTFTNQQHVLTALVDAFSVLQATPILILEERED